MASLPERTDRRVTRSEAFAGVACLLSAGTLIFSLGITYQQVQANTARVERLEVQVGSFIPDVAVIKADVRYLAEQEQRRQRREDGVQ